MSSIIPSLSCVGGWQPRNTQRTRMALHDFIVRSIFRQLLHDIPSFHMKNICEKNVGEVFPTSWFSFAKRRILSVPYNHIPRTYQINNLSFQELHQCIYFDKRNGSGKI